MAPESIKVVGNQIFYLSDTHVYGLFANDFNMVSAQMITKQIESTMRAIPLTEKVKLLRAILKGSTIYLFQMENTCL